MIEAAHPSASRARWDTAAVLDARARRLYAPLLERVARPLDARGASPGALTLAALLAGLGAAAAAGLALWALALVLWLANRLLDGLDGLVARIRGPTDLGGYLDIVGDVAVYGMFVTGVATAVPDARMACVVLLAVYYLNITALFAYATVAERRRLRHGLDERSVRLVPGLVEGTETALAYVLFCLFPGSAETIAWAFAALVAATVVQRVVLVARVLTSHPTGSSFAS